MHTHTQTYTFTHRYTNDAPHRVNVNVTGERVISTLCFTLTVLRCLSGSVLHIYIYGTCAPGATPYRDSLLSSPFLSPLFLSLSFSAPQTLRVRVSQMQRDSSMRLAGTPVNTHCWLSRVSVALTANQRRHYYYPAAWRRVTGASRSGGGA